METDSRTVASIKVDKTWLELIEGWETKRAGKSEYTSQRFDAAQRLSDVRGFRFLSAEEVAREPLENILARVEAVPEVASAPCKLEAAAQLGAVDEPQVMLSGLVAHVEELATLANRRKNRNQMRIWQTPRLRAVRNLIAAI